MNTVIASALATLLLANSAFAGNIPVPTAKPKNICTKFLANGHCAPARLAKAPKKDIIFGIGRVMPDGNLQVYPLNGTESPEMVNGLVQVLDAYIDGRIPEVAVTNPGVCEKVAAMGIPCTEVYNPNAPVAVALRKGLSVQTNDLEIIGVYADD